MGFGDCRRMAIKRSSHPIFGIFYDFFPFWEIVTTFVVNAEDFS